MKKLWNILKIGTCVIFTFIIIFTLSGCSHTREVAKASRTCNTYNIDAVFCDEEKKITATQIVNYCNRAKDGLEYVCFNLYGTAFSEDAVIKPYTSINLNKCFMNGISYGDLVVNSVRVNDINAQFEIVGEDNNALKVWFGFGAEYEAEIKIEIVFVLYLANCTHRLGYYENNVNLGNWYPILCVYENDDFVINSYYSTGDPFYSECSNYNVKFTYPSNYVLASSGVKKDEVVESNKTTVTLSALAIRDFAMGMSNNWQVKSDSVNGIDVNVYAYNGDDKITMYLETAVKAVELFNNTFGEFLYKELNVVFTPFLHGGMEYSNFVMIADNIENDINIKKVIVHEIAHQWWYSVVGNNEVKDAWIDESLAEYSTLLYFENSEDDDVTRENIVKENKNDYLLYIDVMKSVGLPLNSSMQLSVNEYTSEYEYVYMVYVKGVLFLDALRNNIGDKAFFNGLKHLYTDNKFKIINKEDFIVTFEKTSKLDLKEFIEEWLGGNNIIE